MLYTIAGTTGFTSTSITDPSLSNTAYQLLRWTATTGTNSMTVSTAGLFEIFVAGAGKSGNSGSGGAGRAGQLVKQTVYLPVGAYTCIVGTGGTTGNEGGSSTTRSGVRCDFSAISPTTPAYLRYYQILKSFIH